MVTDPPYVAAGMALLLDVARAALRTDRPTRQYLSTNPDLIEAQKQFFEGAARRGLLTLRRHGRRNFYRIAPAESELACRLIKMLGLPIVSPEYLFTAPYWYADLFEMSPLQG